jgi:hypothetical protein
MNYIIPAEILERLIAYLVTRPFQEVAGGMAELQRLQPMSVNPDVEPAGDGDAWQ